MAVNRKKLLEVFKKECENVPERYSGYQDELYRTVADIIYSQYEHSIRATRIQQQITDYCDRLGHMLESSIDKNQIDHTE